MGNLLEKEVLDIYLSLLEHIDEVMVTTLYWRHNGRDSVSNHQPHDCLTNRLFKRRSKKTPKLRVTGLCLGNSPGTDEFPAQMASNAENVSIWWRHHMMVMTKMRYVVDKYSTLDSLVFISSILCVGQISINGLSQ